MFIYILPCNHQYYVDTECSYSSEVSFVSFPVSTLSSPEGTIILTFLAYPFLCPAPLLILFARIIHWNIILYYTYCCVAQFFYRCLFYTRKSHITVTELPQLIPSLLLHVFNCALSPVCTCACWHWCACALCRCMYMCMYICVYIYIHTLII